MNPEIWDHHRKIYQQGPIEVIQSCKNPRLDRLGIHLLPVFKREKVFKKIIRL